jgi:hypothetical protein
MKRYLLVILLMMLFVVQALYAQDDDRELVTYTSPDGSFSVSQPAGWVADGGAEDGSLFAIVTANPDSFFETGPTQAQPGDQAIVFFVVPGAEMGVDLTNVSAETLAQSFTEFLTADSDEPIELGEASAITLDNGVEAGRVGFSGGTGAGTIVVYPADSFVVGGVALGARRHKVGGG